MKGTNVSCNLDIVQYSELWKQYLKPPLPCTPVKLRPRRLPLSIPRPPWLPRVPRPRRNLPPLAPRRPMPRAMLAPLTIIISAH